MIPIRKGFYHNADLLNNINNNTILDLTCRIVPGWMSCYTIPSKFRDFMMDLEPDIFYFNFMGHTGKFFLGNDKKWKVVSDSNLKVLINFTTDLGFPLPTIYYPQWQYVAPYIRYPRVIQKITLQDEKGYKFIFGLRSSERELTFNNLYSQTISSVPIGKNNKVTSTAWYLSRVIDQFDNILFDFEYERGPYIGQIIPQYEQNTEGTYLNNTVATPSPDYRNDFAPSNQPTAPSQLILPCYLKKIKTYSGVEIKFNSSVANSMKYTFNDNTFLNSAAYAYGNTFSNSYYTDRSPQDFTTVIHNPENNQMQILNRLQWKKLDSIIIKDNKSSTQNIIFNYNNVPQERLFLNSIETNNAKKYEFEYYNKNLLPNYLSTAIDHFGYFKGTRFNFYPLTNTTGSINFWNNQYYLERETHPEFVKYGSLKKIIYPTGGHSEFEFEPHTYSKEFGGANGTLHDLSLNKIIGGLRIKKIKDFDSSGNEKIREYFYTSSLSSTVSTGILTKKPVYFDTFSLNHGCQGNEIINFYKVSINNLIPLTNLSGTHIEYSNVIEKFNNNYYNVYKYTDYIDYPDQFPQSPFSSNYWKHLTLTDFSTFRGKLKEKEVYDQNNFKTQKITNKYSFVNESMFSNALYINILDYYDTSYSVITNTNLAGGYKLIYTDNLLVESKFETFFENGQSIDQVDNNEYLDYHYYPDIFPFGDSFLKSKKTTISNTSSSGIDFFKTVYKYPHDAYEETGDNIAHKMITNRILSPIQVDNYKANFTTSDVLTNQEHLSVEKNIFTLFNMYNEDNNLVQIPVINEIVNSKANNIEHSLYKVILRDEIGNILQVEEKNHKKTSYIWGYNKTQPVANLENMSYDDIPTNLITAIEMASNFGTEAALLTVLNALRTSADVNLQKAMITTYTYKPLVGVTSITDPKGNKQTYHYDIFNRLQSVKDAQGNILSENEYHYQN